MTPIVLPFPDRRLSPNARMNRYALAQVKQDAREQGFYAAKESGVHVADVPLQLFVKICPPDKRWRDDDNILSSLKSARDGIFDALGVNDRRVRLTTFGFGDIVRDGAIYLWIVPLENTSVVWKEVTT